MAKKTPKKAGIDGELARRKELSFEQAEGAAELPSQLKTGEISKQLRALLWEAIYSSIQNSLDLESYLDEPWNTILYDKHVQRDYGMIDRYESYAPSATSRLRAIYEDGNFVEVFGLTQWFLRHSEVPTDLSGYIANALVQSKAAYVLIEADTFMPISTPAEVEAFENALHAAKAQGFDGPRAHLKAAAEAMTEGNWAASIRESIHAVEAAAKLIEPSAKTLGPALNELAKKHKIHGALQSGFSSLYGFTSDAKGVRHSLLEKADADVDGIDAQYMLGACASFVSYLIARSRG